MTIIPKISKVMQKKHVGESAAIVDGKIVAFGKDSLDAERKAVEKGFDPEDVMTTYIMGDKCYALQVCYLMSLQFRRFNTFEKPVFAVSGCERFSD